MATGEAVGQIMEEEEAEEEMVEVHGVINPMEVACHVMSLDEALKNMESRIEMVKRKMYCKTQSPYSKT